MPSESIASRRCCRLEKPFLHFHSSICSPPPQRQQRQFKKNPTGNYKKKKSQLKLTKGCLWVSFGLSNLQAMLCTKRCIPSLRGPASEQPATCLGAPKRWPSTPQLFLQRDKTDNTWMLVCWLKNRGFQVNVLGGEVIEANLGGLQSRDLG